MPKQKIEPIVINQFTEDLVKPIFAGQLFCLNMNQPKIISCREELKNKIKETFKPYPAKKAHLYFSGKKFIQRVNALSSFVNNNYHKQVLDLIENAGLKADLIYWDKLVLRVVVPIKSKITGARHEKIVAHRDTWGVNIHSQINFWSPIFSITNKRTIRFYPYHWDTPIKNSTQSWSFSKYLKSKGNNQKIPYPSSPVCLEKPKGGNPIVIKPNQWLIFSAAHLHDSAPNTSNQTRFSLEFRIINQDHLINHIASKNIDNHSNAGALTKIFSNIKNNQALNIFN